jgi:hypothetical protein
VKREFNFLLQWNRYVTFLCGQPGIYALGAAAAKSKGDQQRLDRYLGLFNAVHFYRPKTLNIQELPENLTVSLVDISLSQLKWADKSLLKIVV